MASKQWPTALLIMALLAASLPAAAAQEQVAAKRAVYDPYDHRPLETITPAQRAKAQNELVSAQARGTLPGPIQDIGYAKGVPMGSDLPARPDGKSPSFLIAALKDPLFGNLDRVQIVKGWLDNDGKAQERVYDVVWGDAERRQPGRDGKLPPVGDTVDAAHATWKDTIGDPSLAAVWTDPEFDPSQRAFYYARVIEIPTPRWTAYDQLRFGIRMAPEVPILMGQ